MPIRDACLLIVGTLLLLFLLIVELRGNIQCRIDDFRNRLNLSAQLLLNTMQIVAVLVGD
jgi:hypothetical protein